MASGPYGIAQVDIPSLLGMHQQLKRQRLEDLYTQRKIEIEERKAQQEERRAAAISKVFSPKGGEQSSGSSGATPPSSTASPPAPSNGLQIDRQALQELYAVDPETALKLGDQIAGMDKSQLEAAGSRGEAMASAADAIRRLPPDQRAAELQKWVPWLADRGLPISDPSQIDLSDAGLNRYYTQGLGMKDIIAGNKPSYQVVPQGGVLVNTNDPAALAAVGGVSSAPLPSNAPSNVPNGNPLDPNMRSTPRPIPQRPQGMTDDQIIAQARDAISKGADVNDVFRRMQAWGINP